MNGFNFIITYDSFILNTPRNSTDPVFTSLFLPFKINSTLTEFANILWIFRFYPKSFTIFNEQSIYIA